jgi:hypothetical protein
VDRQKLRVLPVEFSSREIPKNWERAVPNLLFFLKSNPIKNAPKTFGWGADTVI